MQIKQLQLNENAEMDKWQYKEGQDEVKHLKRLNGQAMQKDNINLEAVIWFKHECATTIAGKPEETDDRKCSMEVVALVQNGDRWLLPV